MLALIVTALWSTSFVLTKIALRSMGPLWLAFFRYESAGLVLALVSVPEVVAAARAVGLSRLAALGVLGYAIAQGPFVFALSRLPASTALLVGTVTSVVVVTVLGMVFLDERPTALSFGGIALTVAGLALFAGVAPIGGIDPAGAVAVTFSSIGYGGWLVLGRHMLHRGTSSRGVVAGSMTLGTLPLCAIAAAFEPPPPADVSLLALIAWLAVVNTAVAFTLWAESQRGLRAYESNVLSNLVLVEASLLAFVFLAEPLGAPQWAGIGLVLAGVLLTQLRASGPRPIVPEELEEPLA